MFALAAGCGHETSKTSDDASIDAQTPLDATTGLDASTDAGRDAHVAPDSSMADDASVDAGKDASIDAGTDGGFDAGADGGMSGCAAAPVGADAEQQEALTVVNAARLAMGVQCATMIPALNQSATSHCQYYAAHEGTSACFVSGNPHTEVSTCTQFFTGAQFWDRLAAVSYGATTMFENMAFLGNATPAVQVWIDSVYHRTPVLSPWVRDLGYGHTSGCDTMDFGTGAMTSATTTASYPYAGQTGVPRSFNGAQEGPTPPTPPSGWPSGYPITVFAKGLTEASMTHTLTVDGSATPIAHQWVTPMNSGGFLMDAYVLYANAPLAAQTTYRVQVQGSRGAVPVSFDFTFTTQ